MPSENEKPSIPPQNQPADNLDVIGSDALTDLQVDPESKKESQEFFGDIKRREELKQEFHDAYILLLRVAVMGFIVVFLIRILHFVLPENNAANAGSWKLHGWLTDGQLAAIDRIFFSGAVGAFVARYVRSIVPGNSPSN
jgi:hypothetical protein